MSTLNLAKPDNEKLGRIAPKSSAFDLLLSHQNIDNIKSIKNMTRNGFRLGVSNHNTKQTHTLNRMHKDIKHKEGNETEKVGSPFIASSSIEGRGNLSPLKSIKNANNDPHSLPRLRLEELDQMINTYKISKAHKSQYTKDMYYDNLYDTYRKLNEKTKHKIDVEKHSIPIKKERRQPIFPGESSRKLSLNSFSHQSQNSPAKIINSTKGNKAAELSPEIAPSNAKSSIKEIKVDVANTPQIVSKLEIGPSTNEALLLSSAKKDEYSKNEPKHDALNILLGKGTHHKSQAIAINSRLRLINDKNEDQGRIDYKTEDKGGPEEGFGKLPLVSGHHKSYAPLSRFNLNDQSVFNKVGYKKNQTEEVQPITGDLPETSRQNPMPSNEKLARSRSFKLKVKKKSNILQELNNMVEEGDDLKQNSLYFTEKMSQRNSSNKILKEDPESQLKTVIVAAKDATEVSFAHKKKRSINYFCCF